MIIESTEVAGLMVVEPEKRSDARGSFTRLWCDEEFAAAGIDFSPRQISTSCNTAAGTLRGMHWQAEPHGETKLVLVTQGRVFDVAVDLRDGSRTRLRWFGLELGADGHCGLLVPRGFAHGYITLTEGAEVLYFIDAPYVPEAARGARYDDPAFAIAWPRHPVVMSERDRHWPLFEPSRQCR